MHAPFLEILEKPLLRQTVASDDHQPRSRSVEPVDYAGALDTVERA